MTSATFRLLPALAACLLASETAGAAEPGSGDAAKATAVGRSSPDATNAASVSSDSSDVTSVDSPQAVTLAPGAEATQLFWLANDLYLAGRCSEARTLYERVYELSGERAALFNVAQCFRAVKDCDAARAAHLRYLEVEPDPPAEAQQWASSFTQECPGAAAPAVQESSAPAPLARSVPEPAQQPGREMQSVAPAWTLQDSVGMGLVLGGAVTLGVATWFGYQAVTANSDLERASRNLVGSEDAWGNDERALEQKEARYDAWSVGLGISGLVMAGAGATLLWLEPFSADQRADSASVRVSLFPAGVSCWGEF